MSRYSVEIKPQAQEHQTPSEHSHSGYSCGNGRDISKRTPFVNGISVTWNSILRRAIHHFSAPLGQKSNQPKSHK